MDESKSGVPSPVRDTPCRRYLICEEALHEIIMRILYNQNKMIVQHTIFAYRMEEDLACKLYLVSQIQPPPTARFPWLGR